jgi:hypothetical protein
MALTASGSSTSLPPGPRVVAATFAVWLRCAPPAPAFLPRTEARPRALGLKGLASIYVNDLGARSRKEPLFEVCMLLHSWRVLYLALALAS